MSINGKSSRNLALLIDAENISERYADLILREASALGTLAVRRVYGHFAKPTWSEALKRHALTPVQTAPAVPGKNATDIRLAIDAMDLLHTRPIGGFCLASSDSDFTVLAARIREDGRSIIGFGERKAAEPYVAAYDRFFYCDALLQQEQGQPSTPKEAIPKDIQALVNSVVADLADDGEWVTLGEVANELGKRKPDFDHRVFGHAKLSRFIERVKGIESKRHGSEGGPIIVRRHGSQKKLI